MGRGKMPQVGRTWKRWNILNARLWKLYIEEITWEGRNRIVSRGGIEV